MKPTRSEIQKISENCFRNLSENEETHDLPNILIKKICLILYHLKLSFMQNSYVWKCTKLQQKAEIFKEYKKKQ